MRVLARLAIMFVAACALVAACASPAAAQLGGLNTLLKPSVTSVTAPAGWVGPGDLSVTVSAHGSLLGVGSIELAGPAASAPRVRSYPCLLVQLARCPADWSQTFTIVSGELAEGLSEIRATAVDPLGTRSAAVTKTLRVDRSAPLLDVSGELRDAAWLDDRAYAVMIAAQDGSATQPRSGVRSVELLVDGERHGFAEQSCAAGSCALQRTLSVDGAALAEGVHAVRIVAVDHAGLRAERSWNVGVDRRPPAVELSGALAQADGRELGAPQALRAVAGDPVSGVVALELLLDGEREQRVARPCPNGACGLELEWTLDQEGLEVGPHTVAIVADDASGRRTRKEIAFEWRPNGAPVAPPVDVTRITPFVDQTAFLYTGAKAIQTGVAAGTIQPRRAAVIRGTLRDRTGAPVAGAKVTVIDHPELGATKSRDDGEFYIAVNGGGPLTVRIEHDEFLPVDRQVDVPWQEYAFVDDTVLVRQDPNVTAIDASEPLPELAVHRSSVEEDAVGERRVTLMFPEGLQAEMEMPDGSRRPLSDMHVRATEYTVGETGQAAMPSELPATSAYTYAADFNVDEARAAGAKHVHFSKPVIGYVENYRRAPVGAVVPNGYYERSTQQWIPDSDGRVVKVLSESGGAAVLDVAGSGQPASGDALAALGIDAAELRELAALYAPGQELWRVPTKHFSDWNFSFRVIGAAINAVGAWFKEIITDPCHESGSVIECENQTLGEDIEVTGTPVALHYRSDRVPGRGADRNAIDIPLTRSSLPEGLIAVGARVDVAGRRFEIPARRDWAVPNKAYRFEWDGKDAFGRALQGAQTARVSVGYVYALEYRTSSAATSGRTFATPPAGAAYQFEGLAALCNEDAPGCNNAAGISRDRYALEMTPRITVWRDNQTTLGGFDARAAGLGGWTLTPHHQYDAVAQTLYRGDGSRMTAQSVDRVVNRFAGVGAPYQIGTPGPGATQQPLHGPEGMDVGPDGSVYVADFYNDVIRRVKPDGTMVVVAGRPRPSFSSPRGFSGDGGPATDADIHGPKDVELGPDGSLYIADYGNMRVRKVDPQGTITTVAGNGTPDGARGDDGPATQATVRYPSAVAVAPDGTLFISQGSGSSDHHVRRVGTDGTISTYAGGGTSTASGIRATSRFFGGFFNQIEDIALAPDGSLYIVDGQTVAKVTPDGFIATAAGNGNFNYEFNRTETRTVAPALDAALEARALAVAADGTLYIADRGNLRLWRLDADGKVRVVAGAGPSSASTPGDGDGGPALEARFSLPNGATIGPDGAIYLSDWVENTVRKLSRPLPGFTGSDFAIASEDGGELYRFDRTGRHLQTRDTANGLVTHELRYTSRGLSELEDAHGNTIRVQRDASGSPSALVAPLGQRTALDVGGDGFLSEVRDPANRATTMDYVRNGLLTTFTRPGNVTSRMDYDAGGRLVRDENADGGVKTLARTDSDDGYEVTLSTAGGRARSSRVEKTEGGAILRTATGFDGVSTQTRTTAAGAATVTRADGSKVSSQLSRDPRFGMQSPFAGSLTTTRPSGATSTVTTARSVQLTDQDDLLSVSSITDTATIGGRTARTRWDRAAGTLTSTLPSGRATVDTFDGTGQLVRSHTPGVADVVYRYDGRGRPVEVVQGDRRSAAGYDANGWLSESTDPLGRVTRYTRDALGRVTKTTLPDGREVRFAYTAAGDLESVTPPSRPAHGFAFTLTGLRDAWKPAGDESAVTRYRYDADQQLSAIQRPDGTTLHVDRDGAGRVSGLRRGLWSVDYDYAPTSGALSSVTGDDGTRTSWTYDGDLAVSETTTGAVPGRTALAYDGEGRVTSSTVDGSQAVDYEYDADGLATRIGAVTLTRNQQNGMLTGTRIGSSTTHLSYSEHGELDMLVGAHDGATLFTDSVNRDDAGRVIARYERAGDDIHDIEYGYDAAGRLASVTRDGEPAATYRYDANGNRTSVDAAGAAPVTADYDVHDRLLRHGTTTYRYTAGGDLRERRTGAGESTFYDYDASGSLTGVDLPDGREIRYLTDGLARRIGTRIDGTLQRGFVYGEGPLPSAEVDADGRVRSRFVYATRSTVPDYMVRGGRTYRLFSDQLGSVRLVVDTDSGEIAQRLSYDPWGRVTADTSPGFQPFGYAGGLYDADTGLVRFGARDYDPEVGRWTARDPIDFGGGDTNLYGYVLGDPINHVDPTGHIAFLAVGAAFAAYEGYKFLSGCGSVEEVAIGVAGGVTLKLAARGMGALRAARMRHAVDEAFHYTRSGVVDLINKNGLRPGSYVTKSGNLSPLQAQLDLALPPNRGLPGAVIRVDLAGLREAGYDIGEFTTVARKYNMPGGGTELQLDKAIPPEFLQVIAR